MKRLILISILVAATYASAAAQEVGGFYELKVVDTASNDTPNEILVTSFSGFPHVFDNRSEIDSSDTEGFDEFSGILRPNVWSIEGAVDVLYTGNRARANRFNLGSTTISLRDFLIVEGEATASGEVPLQITLIPTAFGAPNGRLTNNISYSLSLFNEGGLFGEIARRNDPQVNPFDNWLPARNRSIAGASPFTTRVDVPLYDLTRVDVEFMLTLESFSGVFDGSRNDAGLSTTETSFRFYIDAPEGYTVRTHSGFDYSLTESDVPSFGSSTLSGLTIQELDNQMLISGISGEPGVTYKLQSTTDLILPFTDVPNQELIGNGQKLFWLVNPLDPKRFYRYETETPPAG